MRRFLLVTCVVSLVAGCGVDERLKTEAISAGGTGGDSGTQPTASYRVTGSVEQIFVTHAKAGTELVVVSAAGLEVATGKADKQGSYVFRNVPVGKGYRVKSVSPAETSESIDVLGIDDSTPAQSFYSNQKLVPGSGYITTRDGTKLSIYVTMPGPPEKGPYPTVVNYSGYDPSKPGAPLGDYQSLCGTLPVLCDAPSDPSALIAALFGYATVGVNIRGTGCSGGAYDFFEPLQLLDGYDVIETVAAQSWVKGNAVGMTGLSYPGIAELFVAKMHPPSLLAITPLSVIGNTLTTLAPGGIINDGFALRWAQQVLDKADPYGQGWEQAQVDAGDEICKENQLLHSQKVDIIQKAKDNPFYTDEVAAPVNPTLFADQIEVPIFLAGAWQDEQTGPFFFTLLDQFKNAPLGRFTVYNGIHPDGFAPQVLAEWKNFLDFYVAKQKPSIDPGVRTLAPLLFKEIFQASLELPPDRFENFDSYASALEAYEKEPALRVIFENGAKDPPGAPVGTFEKTFPAWPPAGTSAKRFYFQSDGSLGDAPPTASGAASRFALDPAAGQRGILAPGANVWDLLPAYDWKPLETGKAVVFDSTALTEDLVMIGSGSVDVFLRSTVDDADLEVNLSEIRPDGQEMFVQSGWLRASQRKIVEAKSSELWPEQEHREKDSQPLVPGEWVEARIALAAFSHVFRAGSRIRIWIDTPGDSRAEWRFILKEFSTPAFYDIGHSSERPSSIALPVVSGVAVTTPLPACPSLRGQQCRAYAAVTNQAAP